MDEDATYIALFVEEQRRRGRTQGTIRVRNGHLNAVKSAFGTFDGVTPRKLEKWLAERDYKDSTKQVYVDTLSEFFKYGVHCHWFDEDPTEGITFGPEARISHAASTDDDVAALLRAAGKPVLHCWLGLIVYQGLRVQQIAALRREDLDLDAIPPMLLTNDTVIHPTVDADLHAMDLPNQGALFSEYRAGNISTIVNRHIKACGRNGSATSLLMWCRDQVKTHGQNFDRASAADGEDFVSVLAFSPTATVRIQGQFRQGDFEQAVVVAMKAVEVRVRELTGLGNDSFGDRLMKKAFDPDSGLLSDLTSVRPEREGTMNLFRGAFSAVRNPSSHRDVEYRNATQAMEAVAVASLLMRILDQVEKRGS